MDRWAAKPLNSIGSIKFGMSRDAVHGLFKGRKYKEFRKTKFSKNTTDNYDDFHVFYTPDNNVEAVEIFEGIEVVLGNDIIFPTTKNDIKRIMPSVVEENGTLISVENSMGLELSGDVAVSILFGEKGYYE